MKREILFLAAMSALMIGAQPASAEWIAQGIYDPLSDNNVDVSATTTGIGQEIGLADFKTAVAAAFATGNGGVIDFDNHTGAFSRYYIPVSFAGGTKSMNIGSLANDFVTSLFNGNGRTAISGTHMLGNNAYSGGGNFVFDSIIDGQPDEFVTAVGLTLLSRGSGVTNATPSVYTVTAYFSDGSTASKSDTLAVAEATDDTFFGFVAPAGTYINRVVANKTSGTYHTAIDDFGFVTAIVPEPSSLSSLALLILCLLRRRRPLVHLGQG